jgi:hypothetical protein
MGYHSQQDDPEDGGSRLMLDGRLCVNMAYLASMFGFGVRGVTDWSSEEALSREEGEENG